VAEGEREAVLVGVLPGAKRTELDATAATVCFVCGIWLLLRTAN